MDINSVRIAVTVLSFIAFVVIVAYAIHPANRERFDQAGRLPLDEEGR
jgi:cytochrome c oxidase cbb3-type subunit 4